MEAKTPLDFINYWNNFINAWYKDPINHFKSNIHPWGYLAAHRNVRVSLDANALPEPYCGDPNNFSAIILNLNPGGVTPNLQKHPNGSFILDFKPDGTYWDFAQFFPYLTKYPKTSGGNWWGLRDEWIKRLIKTEKNPFAMDICPWHSTAWGRFINNKDTVKYVNDYVIKPAEVFLQKADLKIILSVGKEFEDIFAMLDFKQLTSIGPDKNDGCWPTNKRGEPTKRKYSIWESPTGKRYLNTYTQGSNRCPAEKFLQIELKLLRDALKVVPSIH